MIELGIMTYWLPDSYNIPYRFKNDLYYFGLSSNLLRQHFPKIKLICNEIARYFIIEKLKIPFDQVDLSVQHLENHHIWAAGKLKSYSIQNEPFIHIDHDAFVYERFPYRILNAQLVAQNAETFFRNDIKFWLTQYYFPERLFSYKDILPEPVIKIIREKNIYNPYNMGVFGGTDIEFIKKYADASLTTMNKVNWKEDKIFRDGTDASVILEQFFFGCFVDYYNRGVERVYDFFKQDDYRHQYEHLMDKKNNNSHVNRIKKELQKRFPATYERCANLEKELNMI